MKILGIETSCDETAAAVVENGSRILSNVVVSQIDIFKEYGGVIPEVAARSHLEAILPVVDKALADAKCSWGDIDAIAVTHAPGLLGSLLIGTLAARTLAILHEKPLYAVHHLKSHVYANWLMENELDTSGCETCPPVVFTMNCKNNADKSGLNLIMQPEASNSFPTFPLLAMVISGGHTQILWMDKHNHFEIIGTTRDDAVGECFDKVAKILGLPYPGGPAITKAAKGEMPDGTTIRAGDAKKYKLPKPRIDGLDFSFSGLKTAVLRAVQKELSLPISHPSHDLKNHLTPEQIADFAASFQETAVEILLDKLKKAVLEYPEAKSLVFAGGVSANAVLRAKAFRSDFGGRKVYFPEPKFSGDNGAMVAAAAYFEIISGVEATDPYKLNIYPRISIEE